jgi:integrase
MAKTLTALSIQNSKPRRRHGVPILTEVSDAGCKGLRLVIHPTGHRSWIVRYRFAGRTRKLTLGPAIVLRPGEADPGNGALTLPAARKAASDALHRLAQGFDPGDDKKHSYKAVSGESFASVAEDCFARAKAAKADFRSAERQLQSLRRLVFPALGNRLMATIRRSEVVKLLDSIAVEQGPTMADAILAIIGRVMNDYARRNDDYASVIVRGMRKTSTKERARERILNDAELTAVWRAAGEGGVFGAFVKFLLLTACRRNEASEMTRAEIGVNGNGNGHFTPSRDGEKMSTGVVVWTLPKERNKTKQELVRPLSSAAQVVLAGLPRAGDGDLVFQAGGRRVVSNIAQMKREFDKLCGVKDWHLHDLRRTARSLMSRAGVLDHHAERCLGHVIPGVKGTYDRHKYQHEMLHAYEALAALIANIVEPEQSGKVVHLRGE